MNLPRQARKWYSLAISTTPEITSWDASFDGGETWVAGESATVDEVDVTRWLVAGDLAPTDDEQEVAATLTRTVHPRVRGISAPEIEIEDAPKIRLVF